MVIDRKGLIRWLEDEPVGTIQIDGKLSLEVTGQLMASTGQGTHYREICSRCQIVEPAPQPIALSAPYLFCRAFELQQSFASLLVLNRMFKRFALPRD